jgi:signal transduction histidine kinase
MRSWRLGFVLLAGALCHAAAAAFVLTSEREDASVAGALVGPLIGWLFIGTGLYAERRRPESRTGALMVVLGFAWFFASLAFSDAPLLFTLASFGAGLWGGVFLHIVIAFPSGRLAPGRDRALAVAGYVVVTVGTIPSLLFADPAELGCEGCPENLLFIRADEDLAALTIAWVALLHIVLFVCTFARLGGRWRRAGPLDRLQLTPVYLCALVTFLLGVVARLGAPDLFWAAYGSTALLPFAFLAGLLRTHLSYLDAELRARVEELRASRARLVEAGDAERRRLERDLHDGAQSRLVALALLLRTAGLRVKDQPDAAALLDRAQAELQTSLAELRELARGIHPAVLTDRGLEPALQALAARAPVPVTVESAANGPLPEPVEIAAYFVVSEALANVAKYAGAESATVAVRRANGRVTIEVSDDGAGGADASRGSGLRGLADRVAALDGTLSLDSPPGGGTRLRAEIPVADH